MTPDQKPMTPRTDAEEVDLQECIRVETLPSGRKQYVVKYVPSKLARQLETELSEMRRERDEAREKLAARRPFTFGQEVIDSQVKEIDRLVEVVKAERQRAESAEQERDEANESAITAIDRMDAAEKRAESAEQSLAQAREGAEALSRIATKLREQLAQARACIRDANTQIVGGNAVWWRKQHAEAIQSSEAK